MKKTKIYVIAHTWQSIDLTIEYFYTSHKALKYLGELLDTNNYPIKPEADDNPLEYLQNYWEWLDERGDERDYDIMLEIIKLK
jgi:hypothetical protein